jgi:cytochrome c553
MKKLAFAALVMFGAVSTVSAAGNAADGKAKSATCAACHGMDGNSMVPTFPKLAGQHASYIAKQLADFKSGERKDPTMNGMAAALSEQDMADLGAYYAGNTTAIGSAGDTEKAALGKKLYQGGDKTKGISACMACHGPSGAGNPGAKFPALSGQHSTYIVKALQDFRSGTRANDMNMMMQDVAAKMSDSDMQAVAEYIAGLH